MSTGQFIIMWGFEGAIRLPHFLPLKGIDTRAIQDYFDRANIHRTVLVSVQVISPDTSNCYLTIEEATMLASRVTH
ncbi:hypothetical protein QUA41_25815 [Microcoleus sp. Pol11C1]|uniref:hypothetical protein n=1 Tax=unclassified Microcoleus TaxID=2642155 RepID=UPI002FD456AC